ncbi:MAG: FHA domain-containing protein [Verrucomicrobiales bacterium]|nr:FHA domain-containing protein [Verrucomicrobiales bacterium]
MPRLVLLNPEFDDQSCELIDGTFVVGRSPDSNILIQDDSVAGEHCVFLVWGRELIVRQCDTRSLVLLDGVPIVGQSGVHNGQLLRLGRVEIRVEIQPSDYSETTPISAVFELREVTQPPWETPAASAPFRVLFSPRRR